MREGEIPRSEPARLEERDLGIALAPWRVPGDDCVQLDHIAPTHDTATRRVDQIAHLGPCLLEQIDTDRRRTEQHLVVELA